MIRSFQKSLTTQNKYFKFTLLKITAMKYSNLFVFLFLVFLFILFVPQSSFAAPPPPPPPSIPVDGGISILIAAGVAYGSKKIYDHRKKKNS